jgi:thiol:disulfide interchange protein DsbD
MRGCFSISGFPRTLHLGIALLLGATWASAEATPIPHGTLELIARNQWIAAGQTIDLGLRFELQKGWHIYWINPGDSGEPPRMQWHLPVGLSAGPVQWPTPQRFQTSSIVDYGYEDSVMLIVPLHADASLAAEAQARLGADLRLLVCSHEMCVPGRAQLSLTLPVESKPPAPDAQIIDLFTATLRSLPRPAPANWIFGLADVNDSFVLTAKLGHQVRQATFFPLDDSQVENAAPQMLLPIASGFRLTLRKSDRLRAPIQRLKGVLVISAERSYLIDVPLSLPGTARKAKSAKNLASTGNHP